MPFVPLPNTVQASLRLTYQGEEVENTLHFKFAGAVTPADLAAVAEGLEDWYITRMIPVVPSDVVYREVYAVDMSSQIGGVFTAAGGNGTPGTVSAQAAPGNVTLAYTIRTANRGRSYRGRIFHIGISKDAIVDNEVQQSVVDTYAIRYLELLQAADFGGGELAVASKRTANAWRLTGVVTVATTIVAGDNYVDSQRRRLPGRGR